VTFSLSLPQSLLSNTANLYHVMKSRRVNMCLSVCVRERKMTPLPNYQRGRWSTVSSPVKALNHINIAIGNFAHGASVKSLISFTSTK